MKICAHMTQSLGTNVRVVSSDEEIPGTRILESGSTGFLYDSLQIAHIIGELCADIWKSP